MLMKSMAQNSHPTMVNSIAPGAPKTPINSMANPGSEAQLLRLIPSGRVGDVEDVARLPSGLPPTT